MSIHPVAIDAGKIEIPGSSGENVAAVCANLTLLAEMMIVGWRSQVGVQCKTGLMPGARVVGTYSQPTEPHMVYVIFEGPQFAKVKADMVPVYPVVFETKHMLEPFDGVQVVITKEMVCVTRDIRKTIRELSTLKQQPEGIDVGTDTTTPIDRGMKAQVIFSRSGADATEVVEYKPQD